jgi:hypothetical protein
MPFQPGQSGNPNSRPRGSRNRRSLLAERLYEERAHELVDKTIELALAGDGTALRVCMDRILAPMRERPVEFELPPHGEGSRCGRRDEHRGSGHRRRRPDAARGRAARDRGAEFARTVGTAVIERELRELVKRSTSPRAALPRWVTERASAATVAAG